MGRCFSHSLVFNHCKKFIFLSHYRLLSHSPSQRHYPLPNFPLILIYSNIFNITRETHPQLQTHPVSNLLELFVNQCKFSSNVNLDSQPITNVNLDSQSLPPTLEFSCSKNVPRHFDGKFKINLYTIPAP